MSPLSFAILVSGAVLLIAGFWVLGLSLRNCRPGFEDATGFQEGVPSDMTTDMMMGVPQVEDAFHGAEMVRPVLVGCVQATDRDRDSLPRSSGLMSAA